MLLSFAAWPLWAEQTTKLVILSLIWWPVHLAWLWAGVSLHRLDLAPGTQARINHAMAASMLVTVGLALASSLGQA